MPKDIRSAMKEDDGRVTYDHVKHLDGDIPLTQSASPHAKKSSQEEAVHLTGSNSKSPGKIARHYAAPEMSKQGWVKTIEAKRTENHSGKSQKS